MNICMFSGRLGKEPEIVTFNNGGRKASFSLAVGHSYKDKEGNWHRNTEWHRVVTTNGSLIDKELSRPGLKGRKVVVQGSYRARPYDRDGAKGTAYEIEVSAFDGIMIGDPATAAPASDPSDTDMPFGEEDV